MAEPNWIVPLSDVVGDDQLVEAAVEAIRSGWWSAGPRVVDLEDQFAAFTGSRHAIAVSNGTAALHLALAAAGVGAGDEVIVPSLTFVAAANTIRLVGATPVFCDIVGANDLNLNPEDVETAVTGRTKAILVLHYGGFPCDMAAIAEIASRHGLTVVEDAAHAVGASVDGRACGTFGLAGCFSFFSNKNLPIGEGGMVVTDDDDVAADVRLRRSHGMTTLTWDRHRGHASTYDVVVPGFNYRLDDIRAAMALVQLKRLPGVTARRYQLAQLYVSILRGAAGLELPFASHGSRESAAHHLMVVVLPAGVERENVRAALAREGVQTSVHYPPIHTFSAYRSGAARALPRTDEIASSLLTLPLYPGMSEQQVKLVAERLAESLGRLSSPVGATTTR